MDVVQQMQLVAELGAEPREETGHEAQVALAAPEVLRRHPLLRRLVVAVTAADAVRLRQSRNAGLRPHGRVAELQVAGDGRHRLLDGRAVGVAVDQHRVARGATEQLIDRRIERLAADVPQRRIHGTDRRHGDGPAAPVGALIEVLPRVLDAPRVAADQQRDDVIGEVARHGELAAVHRRIPHAGDAVLDYELQGHDVPPRTADDDARVRDLHGAPAA